jgi:hypothetical protein
MNFYLLKTTGDLNDPSLCLIEDPPEGMGIHDYRLALGRPSKNHFPSNAKVYLRAENRGIKLSGIIGNTKGYFIGSSLVRKVVEQFCPGVEIEYMPFTLFNHKKRVHSTDYCFINPIGSFNCLNENASGIKYGADGEVVAVTQFVLDPKKVADAPDLFRIDKDPIRYVLKGRLAVELQKSGVTNLLGQKLQQND